MALKVLFVGREKENKNVSPIIINQAKSLIEKGVEVDIYPIKGPYLKNFFPLKKTIKKNQYNIIHAHYSLSGILTALSTKKPVVVSLMGAFNKKNLRYVVVRFFIKYMWAKTIVKSESAAKNLRNKKTIVLPNGLDIKQFAHLNKQILRQKLNFMPERKYIVFVANPDRTIKNYPLAREAVSLLGNSTELLTVYNKQHTDALEYMAAADALILTSLSEGSPNVIKEALACRLPIVSTKVGDVEWLLDNVEGCFVASSYNAPEIAGLLKQALSFEKPTNGREKLLSLNLDSESVANKLIDIYKTVLYGK
ncbi:MAG: glycosyltransferase family 4 protein [Bacteroidales bacterium]|nr:glycosyltransferase family 4 protein [Bacteroidales bacterium]